MRESVRKWLTVAGAFLIYFPLGMSWYWGNLSVYINSYFYNRLHTNAGLNAPWALAARLCATRLFAPLAGLLPPPTRPHALLASVLLDTVFFLLTSLAVRTSTLTFNLLFGVAIGVVKGFTISLTAKVVVDRAGERPGLMLSIVNCGNSVGAVFVNHFVSAFINPHDEEPTQAVDRTYYFSQGAVLDRVPSVFLYVGAVFGVVQLVGVALLHCKTDTKGTRSRDDSDNDSSNTSNNSNNSNDSTNIGNTDNNSDNKNIDNRSHLNIHGNSDNSNNNNYRSNNNNGNMCSHININGNNNRNNGSTSRSLINTNISYSAYGTATDRPEGSTSQGRKPHKVGDDVTQDREPTVDKEEIDSRSSTIQVDSDASREVDISPREMVRTWRFYALFLTFMLTSVPMTVANAFYKAFGLLATDDDHFLAGLGSVNVLGSALANMVWGLVLDKCPSGHCLVAFHALSALLAFLVYFTPRLSIWLYCVTAVAFVSTVTPSYVIYNTQVVRLFGRKHFVTNLPLVFLGMAPMQLASSAIINAVLDRLGWFALYCFSGLVSTANLLCLALTF